MGGINIYTIKPLCEKRVFNKIDDGKRPYIVAEKPPIGHGEKEFCMKSFRHPGITCITLVILILTAGLSLIGCGNPASSSSGQTPVADDFTFSNMYQSAGSVVPVVITPKEGKSTGKITVKYNGNTTLPTAEGTYPVTFDVGAASGWKAVKGLIAGTLTINAAYNPNNQTPVATDFNFSNMTQTAGSVTAVIITPKTGKTSGTITIFYNGSSTIPQTAGSYPVTFNVYSAPGWNAASGLSAGTLTVNAVGGSGTPTVADFSVTNTNQLVGSVTDVIITPLPNKSTGRQTIYYEGISPTTYTKSTTPPSDAGRYAVTFDVAPTTGWNGATGLDAGTLTVRAAGGSTPAIEDYTLGNNTQTANKVTAVTITKSSTASPGSLTIRYVGSAYAASTTPPQNAGDYVVTLDVAAVPAQDWNAATTLYMGILSVEKDTPVIGDFTIDRSSFKQNAGVNSVRPPSITARSGKTDGTLIIYYLDKTAPAGTLKSTSLPTASGNYIVSFDVTESRNWKERKGFSVDEELVLSKQKPVADDFIFGNMVQTLSDGVVDVTIDPKPGKSKGDPVNIKYDGGAKPTTVGNFRVTFDVEEDVGNGWLAETNLSAGILIVNTNKTPKAADYTINTNTLLQTAGKVVDVTIARTNTNTTSPGLWTIWYEGANYPRSTTPPQTVGIYTITFDVAAAAGPPAWNAVTGLVPQVPKDGGGTKPAVLTVQMGVKSDNITIGWSDAENKVMIDPPTASITSDGSVTFKVEGFKSQEWYLNGVSTNNTTNEYQFKDGKKGTYTVSVFVSREETVGDSITLKWYNGEVIVTVTQ